jgi:hypothetical protein
LDVFFSCARNYCNELKQADKCKHRDWKLVCTVHVSLFSIGYQKCRTYFYECNVTHGKRTIMHTRSSSLTINLESRGVNGIHYVLYHEKTSLLVSWLLTTRTESPLLSPGA